MHKLGSQGATIGLTQCLQEITQGHIVFTEECVTGIKDDIHIAVTKAIESWIKFGNIRPFGTL